ncbi:hypothetical protein JS530_03060 [Bifidobacterium sp. LC6]|uniref:Uncharacterized protein n=1 Tax=Bifidobacterium colobi TaxID=2809026 RepID=A0ABS5UUK8_9BIFI|nr:hypothetical protein [Bifidobacterium colobi]MBT1174497.1 hypothetical protein [Bifidobacterium colobi]
MRDRSNNNRDHTYIVIAVIGGIVAAIVLVFSVFGWIAFVGHSTSGREENTARSVETTEEFIAKTMVANYSGINEITFTGYSYNGSGYTSYFASVNGVENVWHVAGKPGASHDLQTSSDDIKDVQAYNEGWLGGDKSSGAMLRKKALAISDVSLDDVKVIYSTVEIDK